jgi:methyltransferase (TIGR00027 family)
MARWIAAQRAALARTRPSTPSGDPEGERRLYRNVAGVSTVPFGRADAVTQRTRVVDAEVARAVGHGTPQVVLLGAGYDGRALRFWDGTVRWFEVDVPTTQADKRARLRTLGLDRPGVTYVAVDLAEDVGDLPAALRAAGHDGGAPSLYVCEGLLSRLTLAGASSLCDVLRGRAPGGSRLVADFVVTSEAGATARVLRRTTNALLKTVGEPRHDELRPGDPEKLMVVTGWHVTHWETSAPNRSAGGSRLLVVVCEPDER